MQNALFWKAKMTSEDFIRIFGNELRANPHVSDSCKNAINIIKASGPAVLTKTSSSVNPIAAVKKSTPDFSKGFKKSSKPISAKPVKVVAKYKTSDAGLPPARYPEENIGIPRTHRYYINYFLKCNEDILIELHSVPGATYGSIADTLSKAYKVKISGEHIKRYIRRNPNV
jgi:hypothetical protein